MSRKKQARLLADKLRGARMASGLSQIKVAHLLNKPQSYVSRCESAARRVDVFELEEFARLYDKPLAFFMRYDEALVQHQPAFPQTGEWLLHRNP